MATPRDLLVCMQMLRAEWRQSIMDAKRLRANTIFAKSSRILADMKLDAAARVFAAYVQLRKELGDA